MCHFITANAVYTSCLLWEQASDEASAAAAPNTNTSAPSQLTRLLRIFQNNSRNDNTPVVGAPGPSTPAALPEELKLAVHVIKERTYFQCKDARKLIDSAEEDLDKRFCPDAKGPPMAEGAPVKELESHVRDVPCPVCEAARIAVDQELNHRYEVRPVGDDGVEATPPAHQPVDRDRLRPENGRPNRRRNDPPGITRVGTRRRDEPIPRERPERPREAGRRDRTPPRRRRIHSSNSDCSCM